MKRFIIILLTFGFVVFSTSCNKNEYNKDISVILPSGTPLVAIGGLMDEYKNIESVTNTDLLKNAFISGNYDIVIAPLTLGTSIYLANKSKYILDSIITINNTYVVTRSDNQLNSIEDLSDKSMIAYQETNTPGILLKMATKDISVEIKYEKAISDALVAFKQGLYEYSLMAEPQLTQLQDTLSYSLNVLNISNIVANELEFMPQAAIYVNGTKKDDKDINMFLNEIKDNINYMNSNPENYANDLLKIDNIYFRTLGIDTIKRSIPRSNITYIKAIDNKDTLIDYYKLMDKYANNMFGGKIPNEEYYKK